MLKPSKVLNYAKTSLPAYLDKSDGSLLTLVLSCLVYTLSDAINAELQRLEQERKMRLRWALTGVALISAIALFGIILYLIVR